MADARHGKCGKTFPNSSRVGHCGGCHETFVGLGAFDQHRIGQGKERRCLDLFDGIAEFWQDDRGFWHFGAKLTEEQKETMWGAKA